MSGKKRKSSKQKSPLPLVLLIGGLLLVAAGVVFALQTRGNGEDGGTPNIAVSPGQIDYGDVKLNTPLTFQIEVANTGDGTLRIVEDPYLEVLEGC